MTLIVGQLAMGGVVIGADGAATLGPSARQGTRKLTSIDDRAVVAIAGSAGLGQLCCERITDAVRKQHNGVLHAHTSEEARRRIAVSIHDDVNRARNTAQMNVPLIGQQQAVSALHTQIMMGMSLQGVPTLVTVDSLGSSISASQAMPYVTAGSGKVNADPFLAFLHRVFWPSELPTISEAVFGALWTLRHAISTLPGGVYDPIQLMVVEDGAVRELSPDDLEGHEQNVQQAEDHLRDYTHTFATGGGDAVAPVPVPAEGE